MVYANSIGKLIGEPLVIRPLQHLPGLRRKLKAFAERLMIAGHQRSIFVTRGKEYPITEALTISQFNKEVHPFFLTSPRPT
jgi:hypothetical protein